MRGSLDAEMALNPAGCACCRSVATARSAPTSSLPRVVPATCMNRSLRRHTPLQLKGNRTITEILFPSRGASETLKLCMADPSCLRGSWREQGAAACSPAGGLWVAHRSSWVLHVHLGHLICLQTPLPMGSVGWNENPTVKGEVWYAAASLNAS